MKLLGSLCILGGGCGICFTVLTQRRDRWEALQEMIAALRRIMELLRMTHCPLPQLFSSAAEGCRAENAAFFRLAALAARESEDLEGQWNSLVIQLSFTDAEKQALKELGTCFGRDEAGICSALELTVDRLEESAREHKSRRADQDRQTVSFCLSGAALLMILLI